jgi:hypothetical protein
MLDKAGVGVQVSNQLINSLLFVDDITLIANSEQELNTLIDITSKFADKCNLKFNTIKIAVFSKNTGHDINFVIHIIFDIRLDMIV